MQIPGKNNNILETFGPHWDEKFILEEQKLRRNYSYSMGKSINIESFMKNGLLGYIFQDWLLVSELSSFFIDF